MHTRYDSIVARHSCSSDSWLILATAYSGSVAMMPWAPEPVMLMAGMGTPMTRASMAALQSSEAERRSSREMTSPPFMASSFLPNRSSGSRMPALNSARLTL